MAGSSRKSTPYASEEENASQRLGAANLSDDSDFFNDDGSGDEYQDSDPDPENEDEAAENGNGVIGRLAGFASEVAAGPGLRGGFQTELERDDDDDLPEPRRRKVPTKGKKRVHKPSHPVQHLLGQANMAYLMEDHEKAIKDYLEVIRLDPYVPAAWKSISTCYQEMGDIEKARQMRFLGAHLDDDGEGWRELAQEFRRLDQLEQTVYCLRKALRYEPDEIDLLWDLGSIYRILNQKTRGSNIFHQMLAVEPSLTNNFEFISTFHSLLLASQQRSVVAETAKKAFRYHLSTYLTPTSKPIYANAPPPMKIEHLISLLDDLIALEEYEDALPVVKSGQRWFQGRGDQKQWDTFEDDTEYDPPGTLRDGQESEGCPMDDRLRHRLAIIRVHLNDMEEANQHINSLLNLDPLLNQPLLISLGDTLSSKEHWERALECFAAIQECEQLPDDTKLIYKIGICQWKLGELDEALEAFEWVVSVDPENYDAKLKIASVLEELGRKAEALDIVTEVIRTRASKGTLSSTIQPDSRISKRSLEDQMKSQMHNLWMDVQDAERGTMEGEEGALERFVESAGVLVENYRMDRSNFVKSRGVVRVLKSRKGNRHTIDDQAIEMQDRLERTLGFEDDVANEYHTFRKTTFYGLSNEEWLALIVKYCCVLMVRGEEDVAMDILDHVVWSGLFHNRRCEIAIRLTMIACAMRTRSYDKITESAKYLIIHSQFIPQPFLIMLQALSTGGFFAHAVYTETPLQTLLGRELRTYDEAVRTGQEKLHFREGTGRWSYNKGRTKAEDVNTLKPKKIPKYLRKKRKYTKRSKTAWGDLAAAGEEEEEKLFGAPEGEGIGWGYKPVLPTRFSAYWNVFVGQEMLVSKSYQGAIFYFTRAFEIDQWNPFICLLLAQAFLGRAMQRQSDNRNYQISQGLIFLARYRKISPKSGSGLEEVEYNFGRAFHALGVPNFAVKHYEAVLTSVEKRMTEAMIPEDVRRNSLAWEAAHNLMLLYATAGNTELVKQKSKWMAI